MVKHILYNVHTHAQYIYAYMDALPCLMVYLLYGVCKLLVLFPEVNVILVIIIKSLACTQCALWPMLIAASYVCMYVCTHVAMGCRGVM